MLITAEVSDCRWAKISPHLGIRNCWEQGLLHEKGRYAVGQGPMWVWLTRTNR